MLADQSVKGMCDQPCDLVATSGVASVVLIRVAELRGYSVPGSSLEDSHGRGHAGGASGRLVV